jgi:hypothetical protein
MIIYKLNYIFIKIKNKRETMGNCCDFIEHDVRDKIHGQQQGTILSKSSKRIHNVFRDKSNVSISCN